MFQGKYLASAAVNEMPSWTSKDKVIWYGKSHHGMSGWKIGNGKQIVLYSHANESFPYDTTYGTGTEFVVPFSSRSQVIIKKSSNDNLFCSKG